MCWGVTATAAMMGLGAAATLVTFRRGDAPAIWGTLGYFTLMEGLQFWGYGVKDACGTPSNQAATLLSYLHIVFQPMVINAFAMAIAPSPVSIAVRRWIFWLAGLSSCLILARLLPWDAVGSCLPWTAMCSDRLCLTSGTFHIAWELPLNGIMAPVEAYLGRNVHFPEYFAAVFVLPLFYGAWRFVLFHLLAGPLLAMQLTSDPSEIPAVWCLFSIGILLISLSPMVRHRVFKACAPAR